MPHRTKLLWKRAGRKTSWQCLFVTFLSWNCLFEFDNVYHQWYQNSFYRSKILRIKLSTFVFSFYIYVCILFHYLYTAHIIKFFLKAFHKNPVMWIFCKIKKAINNYYISLLLFTKYILNIQFLYLYVLLYTYMYLYILTVIIY